MLSLQQSCFVIFIISNVPIQSFFWELYGGVKNSLVLVSLDICPSFVFLLCSFMLYPLRIMNQNCETRSLNFIFFFLIMACVICWRIKILAKNGVLIVFLMVLIWMCAYDNKHMMVTHILFIVVIWQWHGCWTHNIFYPCYLCLLLLLMLIGMVFLAPLPPPLGFFLPLPLRFLLSIPLVLPSLHCILKLTTHTCHHLDHFHSFHTSCGVASTNDYWFTLLYPNRYPT